MEVNTLSKLHILDEIKLTWSCLHCKASPGIDSCSLPIPPLSAHTWQVPLDPTVLPCSLGCSRSRQKLSSMLGWLCLVPGQDIINRSGTGKTAYGTSKREACEGD